jgi:hypothetical protein
MSLAQRALRRMLRKATDLKVGHDKSQTDALEIGWSVARRS